MEFLNIFFTPDFYSATFRLATPLMLAALGGVISERSGVLNMALEGQILMGAFFGYLGSYLFQNVWLGVLTAMLGSLFLAALHAFMSIKVKVNQVVSAVGLNTLALGITSTLFRFLFGTDSQMASCPGMMNLDIPVLFSQHPLTYIAVALLILLNLFLFRTSRGLELRAAGENPKALDVAGVDVIRIRWLAVLATGLFCGLAGASLTLTGLNTFYDNLSSGRGFIAYAAVVFGKWTPVGAALAAILFGAGDALQLRMQTIFDIPYYFYMMMGAAKGPAANSIPFEKDKGRRGSARRSRTGGN